MTGREWLITAAWVVTMGGLLWWSVRRIDRQEEELEQSAEMQNWPEG